MTPGLSVSKPMTPGDFVGSTNRERRIVAEADTTGIRTFTYPVIYPPDIYPPAHLPTPS